MLTYADVCTADELLGPAVGLPKLAFTDPAVFWEKDWGGAWLLYYGQVKTVTPFYLTGYLLYQD